MPNSFFHALAQWLPLKSEHQWVLGAIINTRGSVYRKTGALMMLSDAGHQLGLLSGGCLENDLLLQARKVAALRKSRRVVYDANDEGSLAWRLGIGCGGAAEILLHPCTAANEYLQLGNVFTHLQHQQACQYQLSVETAQARYTPCEKTFRQRAAGELTDKLTGSLLTTVINPTPHLLILGSGVDMIPLCNLAITMGWQVTLADQRLSIQRRAEFPAGVTLIQSDVTELHPQLLQHLEGVVVAHHNVSLDAAAIRALQDYQVSYIGLLGPAARKREVLAAAGLAEDQLTTPVAGPMGLALGGDLPESIALAVLAECHAVIHGSTASAMSGAYWAQEPAAFNASRSSAGG
jgi:xanthine dehydrogenase accessory factor